MNTIIKFKDPILESVIRETINKPIGIITKKDVSVITRLYYYGRERTKITSVHGIENLINLKRLILRGNKIVDISPLSCLTNLTTLVLGHNKIVDISPLSCLININYLGLENNKIVNVSPLSNLTKITNLFLDNNNITDISRLSSLVDLVMLYLRKNKIIDISDFLNNVSFKKDNFIYLRGNQLNEKSKNIDSKLLSEKGINICF